MANTDSTEVTNFLADPSVRTPVGQWGGRVRTAEGNFELTGANFDAASDTVRLTRLPAQARIRSLRIGNDALDGGTDSIVDIGLYEPAATPATAADLDCFVDGSTQFRAASPMLERLATTTASTVVLATALPNVGDPLYTWAGDSLGDFAEYDIVMTNTATVSSDADGTVAYVIEYTID
jgi:hypothetical protein